MPSGGSVPANLIVALVLLGVEALKAYRAKQEHARADHEDPRNDHESPRG